jgi:hypothetical protein
MELNDLHLSSRALKGLYINGIKQLDQLLFYTPSELAKFKGIGHRIVWEIQYTLRKINMKLPSDTKPYFESLTKNLLQRAEIVKAGYVEDVETKHLIEEINKIEKILFDIKAKLGVTND